MSQLFRLYLRLIFLVVAATSLWATTESSAQEVSAGQVRQSIQGSTKFLLSYQNRQTGGWPEYLQYPGGSTALCTLALMQAGVPADDPAIVAALNYLRRINRPVKIYPVSLKIMALCAANRKDDLPEIKRLSEWLESVQISEGEQKGGWSYGVPDRSRGIHGTADHSNSQFAVLALHEAERVGIKINRRTWKLANDYWKRYQLPDGSWNYRGGASTGSMTCAGIASLIITSGKLSDGDATVSGETVQCCGKQSDQRELDNSMRWLAKKFSARANPGRSDSWYLYYMYGVERVGRLSGQRFFGTHDWYREGAEVLVRAQREQFDGSIVGAGEVERKHRSVSTALALLFLSKGRRPVVLAQARFGGNGSRGWNRHRSAVHNLTRDIEKSWKQLLTWQTININVATTADLLESPVLFISGGEPLNLSAEQKNTLREYVNNGGFIFAEKCCNNDAFEKDFKALMKELFPESNLSALGPDHPVWFAQHKIAKEDLVDLYGVNACCRTSVIYCPVNLSCYWELGRTRRGDPYAATVERRIDSYLKLGSNIVAYATNRQLKEKLDRPSIALATTQQQTLGGVLEVPKIFHQGGSNDAPNALNHLLASVSQRSQIRIATTGKVLSLTDRNLANYSVLFIHGRRDFRLSPQERKALATFVDRGGFIFGDAICASPEFNRAFEREMSAVFPEQALERIDPNHPMFTDEFHGFDIRQVSLRDPGARVDQGPIRSQIQKVTPFLKGITVDERIAVLFSPYDLSCALENQASLECKGYLRDDAIRIGTNVLLFAMQQ